MPPYVGLFQYSPNNLQDYLLKASENKYEKIVVSLRNNELPSFFEHCTENDASDIVLHDEDWKHQVIVMLPDYECDSTDQAIRENSEKALIADLAYAEHLVKTGDIMIRLKSGSNTNLAHLIRSKRKWNFLVQVPFCTPSRRHAANRIDLKKSMQYIENEDTWDWWNSFRWVNQFQSRLKAVLELLETEVPPINKVKRWLSEPLEAVIVPASLFIYDTKNKPFLPSEWYEVMSYFIRGQVNIIVSTGDDDSKLKDYCQYFLELQNYFSTGDSFNVDYDQEDEVTYPAQAVQSDIPATIYEELESDTIKYILYQNAIEQALKDLLPRSSYTSRVVIIAIVGVGRGPLIDSVFSAVDRVKCKTRVYVVEKNKKALKALNYLLTKKWNKRFIKVIDSDMRECQLGEKADIIISELFGSFGDNELSPECLACTKNLLKRKGISIPSRSTSFINPVMAPRILASQRDLTTNICEEEKDFVHIEASFVTILRRAYHISLPKPLFKFEYSGPQTYEAYDYKRFKIIQFKVKLNAVFNGLAGYFEADLYKNFKLSINRVDRTPGLLSWFPVYFPFSQPIDVKAGDIIEIHFWRRTNLCKVWYEWCCMKPVKTHIHNFQGRYSSIYLK